MKFTPSTPEEGGSDPSQSEAEARQAQAQERLRKMWEEGVANARDHTVSELSKLMGREQAQRMFEAHQQQQTDDALVLPGGDALLDVPPTPAAIWGFGDNILWADGEAIIFAGLSGLGKTTLAQQAMLGLCGVPGYEVLLGYPITPMEGRGLYLAMDRPKQAQRSFSRMVTEEHRQLLNERLTFRAGPPPRDFATDPDVLLELCREADASVVVVDSIKDAAIGIAKDEVGAGYNRARQTAIAAGVQVIELHHNRKEQQGSTSKPSISDVYGSTWITSGAGSVILLDGQPGDPVVHFHHVKQPMAEVGPFHIIHDHATGRSSVVERPSLLEIAREPVTAAEAAKVLFDLTASPTRAQTEKARRQLDALAKKGQLTCQPGGKKQPTTWVITA